MDIYNLDVIEVPTNVAVARTDEDDEVYRTAREKYEAIVSTITEARQRGQPVLVGTTSIEKSEVLSGILKSRSIEHNVLNARYHEQEAHIIAQAGVPGNVTIATNMAGRGTDIKLGGNAEMRIATELADMPEGAQKAAAVARINEEVEANKRRVIEAGGLFVIGTERHESRRIDNQLRGRSGRQGDPGRSRFYLSLEDDLMRIFGSDRLDGMLKKLGLKEGEAIIHPWINKALEKAQQKVEARNFEIRKEILKYDNVMNDQRKVIFDQRIGLMHGEEIPETIDDMRRDTISELIAKHIPENAYPEEWDATGLRMRLREAIAIDFPVDDWAKEEGIADEEIRERVTQAADSHYAGKREKFGKDIMVQVEKAVLLRTLDRLWRDHIITLEYLRQVINLRAYGQRRPIDEYKTEAFSLFQGLVTGLKEAVTGQMMRVEIQRQPFPDGDDGLPDEDELPLMEAHHIDPATGEDDVGEGEVAVAAPPRKRPSRARAPARDPNNPSTWGKVGRNDQCPCGSGKRYKHCHGAYT
jgi:preprotein translocase subunit SecA